MMDVHTGEVKLKVETLHLLGCSFIHPGLPIKDLRSCWTTPKEEVSANLEPTWALHGRGPEPNPFLFGIRKHWKTIEKGET